MHNPKSVLVNETHRIPRNFKIKTDYLISVRRSELMIINKKENNLAYSGLCRASGT